MLDGMYGTRTWQHSLARGGHAALAAADVSLEMKGFRFGVFHYLCNCLLFYLLIYLITFLKS